MRSSKYIEKIVRDGKPNVKTSKQLDKLILDGSHSIMDEFKLPSPKFNMLMLLVRNKIAVCVTSVVVIVIVGLFVFQSEPENNFEPPKVIDVTQTPANMMSLLSINL